MFESLSVLLLVLFGSLALRAETRGRPFTEEQLLERSSVIFVGEVLEVTAFERYKRTVPSRVRVLISIKGKMPQGDRDVVPKDPGNFVYFDEEFSRATKGGVGVFFVGTKENPKLLMGYKALREGQNS